MNKSTHPEDPALGVHEGDAKHEHSPAKVVVCTEGEPHTIKRRNKHKEDPLSRCASRVLTKVNAFGHLASRHRQKHGAPAILARLRGRQGGRGQRGALLKAVSTPLGKDQ